MSTKLITLFAVHVGVCAARKSPIPVISLDLDENSGMHHYTGEHAGVGCAQSNSDSVSNPLCRARRGPGFRQDFAKICIAKASNTQNCPLPKAEAYDRHEGTLEVQQKIYLVNDDGKMGDLEKSYDSIDYSKRSEWLIKFDAEDESGNKAEQVVFGMIMNDPIAPEITSRAPRHLNLEACDSNNPGASPAQYWKWVIPTGSAAVDNIDGDLVSIYQVETRSYVFMYK
jgi:hypothetical protein